MTTEELNSQCKTVIVKCNNWYQGYHVKGDFEMFREYTDMTWDPVYLAVSEDVEVRDKDGVLCDYNELSDDIIHEIEEDVLNRCYA